MKCLDAYRMRLLLIGVVTAIVLGSGENATADFTFGAATNLGSTINTAEIDGCPSISADGLSLYFFSRSRPGGHGLEDLWVTTRPSTGDPWGEPENLGPVVNTSNWGETSPSISADGLSLYFDSGPFDHSDIWIAEREAIDRHWQTRMKLGPNVNHATWQFCPSISADGMQLHFDSKVAGQDDCDLWVSMRQRPSDPWLPATRLSDTVNSPYNDSGANVSADGLAMFFHSDRPGGYGYQDLYVTTRPSIYSNWGEALNLGSSINTPYSENDASVSADGRMLYFSENPSAHPGGMGGLDIWQAPIIPVVDFNGDYQVNIEDLSILIKHWGQNEPSLDMGPMPWGDGIVDDADLAVLMSYWGQEVYDPHLKALWKLDETEGAIAYDSAGRKDATVAGGAVWEPAGGRVSGALQFDGIDDHVTTPFVLAPDDGPFSVFAWVKGGVPGQVIISQMWSSDWLVADPQNGCLETMVKGTGRGSSQLCSETIITDGNWHHVGLVWDGSNRFLYVDDILVAADTQLGLQGAKGLYIGCGKDLEAGSFWTGMIDDVRIYNRVVKP
jgi:hypothetical protein